ncbi:MAG TPA: TonB-dependent receptor [Bacteroidota bacterium]|nr:TonB-dependent receptor [Bacteroidota bacterium]
MAECVRALLLTGISLLLSTSQLQAQADTTDLTKLSLEELVNITVTSVSKREEKLSEAAAAVYVITQEDMIRTGLTSIPEALRMVPGVQVAQIDANKWSITSRGFNGRFANKLLVLIDGRSVYSPLFSGVHWDIQDVPVEDIQRIEVIRGPGATLWGANAVNGVINIITRSAKENRGGIVTGGGGTEDQGFGSIHYSGPLSSDARLRVYGKGYKRDNGVTSSGDDASDNWKMYRGGFRTDWDPGEGDLFTFQGDVYDGDMHQGLTVPSLTAPYSRSFIDNVKVSGGNLLARWNHGFSDHGDLKFQLYFDRTYREDSLYTESRNTFDLDFQNGFSAGARQKIIWGLGYRSSADQLTNSITASFDPRDHQHNLANVFVQDHVTLVDSSLFVTLGSKFEYNDYTKWEIQPNARVLWTLQSNHTSWASVSRAVRTPSRAEENVHANLAALPDTNTGLTYLIMIAGNSDFKSEELLAYEIGHRYEPVEGLSLDVTAFYNIYKHLRTGEPGLPSPLSPSVIVLPIQFDNRMDGETYGIEFAGSWRPLDFWKLNAGYTSLRVQLYPYASSQDVSPEDQAGDTPRHQFHCRSYLNIARNLELDAALYYVDPLAHNAIPAYTRLDCRVGWHMTDAVSMSFVVQNILDAHHPEFGTSPLDGSAAEVQRGGYGKITVRF